MTFYVSLMVSIGATFLIQQMVEEKENRMRESLRIMSLTPLSYGGSFFLFQAIFAALGSLIVGAWCFGNEVIFPIETTSRSIQFVLLLMAYQVA
jgi:ABC-type Na+ efflux pump permease subunit